MGPSYAAEPPLPPPLAGCETFSSTLHFGPYEAADGWARAHAAYTLPTGDLSTDFHTYG